MGDPAEETFCRPNLKLSKNLHRFSKSVSKTTNKMTIGSLLSFRYPYPYANSLMFLRNSGKHGQPSPQSTDQTISRAKLSSMNVVFWMRASFA